MQAQQPQQGAQPPEAPPEEPGPDYEPNEDERSALPQGMDVEQMFKSLDKNTIVVEVR